MGGGLAGDAKTYAVLMLLWHTDAAPGQTGCGVPGACYGEAIMQCARISAADETYPA
jgi:hypothetical protein